MKANLISFEKKTYNIEQYTPHFKIKVVQGVNSLNPEDVTNANFYGGVDKIYDLIQLHSFEESIKRTEYFYVNHDDVRLAFPIIDGMIQTKTQELQKHLNEANEARMIAEIKLKRIRGFWYNRLWIWISNKFDALISSTKRQDN